MQLWRHAIALVGEVVLDSIARVRSRCSAIGRNAMAMDLSEAGHGLRNTCPHEDELRIAVDVSTRFVDNYIKVSQMDSVHAMPTEWSTMQSLPRLA